MKRALIIGLALLAAISVAVVAVVLAEIYHVETAPVPPRTVVQSSPSAVTSVSLGGEAYIARVQVEYASGRPVVGASVDVTNNSGSNIRATAASGCCSVDTFEDDVLSITVNDVEVFAAPHKYQGITEGLSVHIVILNPRAFGLAFRPPPSDKGIEQNAAR